MLRVVFQENACFRQSTHKFFRAPPLKQREMDPPALCAKPSPASPPPRLNLNLRANTDRQGSSIITDNFTTRSRHPFSPFCHARELLETLSLSLLCTFPS